jgi:hypothetical protein
MLQSNDYVFKPHTHKITCLTTNSVCSRPELATILTQELTPRRRVFLATLTVPQLPELHHSCYEIPTDFLNIQFNIIIPSKHRSSTWPLFFRFANQILYALLLSTPHTYYMPNPSDSSLFHLPNITG